MKLKIQNLLRKVDLNTRLMTLFLLVSFLPVLIASVFTLSYFYKINIDDAKKNLQDKLHTINLIYHKKVYDIEQTTRLASLDNLVRINLELELYQPISNYLATIISSKQLSFLSVLDSDGNLIISGNASYFRPEVDPVFPSELFNIASGTGYFSGTVQISSESFLRVEGYDQKEATAMLSLFPVRTKDGLIAGYLTGGYVIGDFPGRKESGTLLKEMKKTVSADVLLLHSNSVISYTDPDISYNEIEFTDEINTTDFTNTNFINMLIDHKKHIFSFVPIHVNASASDLLVGSGMPVSRFQRTQRMAATALSIIALAAMIIAAISAYFISRSISTPILKMEKATRSMVNGNFNERVKIRSKDEVGRLAEAFNTMTENLSYRIAMDNLISHVSRHFITFQGSDANEAVTEALGEVARFIKADRAGVFTLSDDFKTVQKTHRWNRVGVKSNPVIQKTYGVHETPWLSEKIREGEVVIIDDIASLPDEAEKEKEFWEMGELKSLIFVPMYSVNILRGYIGFAFLQGNNTHLSKGDIIQILSIIAELICNTIDRKKYEQNINATRNLLKRVFNAQQTMMISVNDRIEVTMWNDAVVRFTGITSENAVAKSAFEVFPELSIYTKLIEGVLSNKKPVYLHHEIIGRNKRYCNISFIPLHETNDSGILIQLQDVTDETKKDYQLQQAQKMETVRHLAGGLSHDFNNAIGGIFATVSYLKYILEEEEYTKEEISESLELISQSSKSTIEMIRRLVAISKKSELNYMPIDLRNIINNIIQTGKHLFDKSVEITTEVTAVHPYINGDHTQIEQMLLNLCINACHAMTIMRNDDDPRGGKLHISLTNKNIDALIHPGGKEGRYLLLKVSDEGIGMNEETKQKIFDPFFTTKDKSDGTGMGLSMVYNTVQQHNGIIDVYSEPGLGTTFNIYLPELVNYESNQDEVSEETSLFHGTESILVIDDEPIIRNIFNKILHQCGYKVTLTENGEQGIDVFSKNQDEFDLIILDISMPHLSGDQVFNRIKQIDPNIPILLTSGFDQDKRVKRIEPTRTAGFLHKPFTMSELSKTIYGILHQNNRDDS